MTVHRSWPAGVLPIERLEITDASATEVSTLLGGAEVRRSFQDVPRRRYGLRILVPSSSTTGQRRLQRLLRLLRGRLHTVWLAEPVDEYHEEVLLGRGDGSTTTFPLRGRSVSGEAVYVDGAAVTYTLHTAANQLGDDEASLESGTGSLAAVGTGATLSRVQDYSADGIYCAKVAVSAATSNYGLQSSTVSASPGDVLTGHVSARADGVTGRVVLEWLDSGDATISESTASASLSLGSWTELTVTATAPALTASVRLRVEITDSSDTPLYADALGIAPGDLTDWWLPSESPAVVELAAAPADGATVTARFSGRRCTPVRLARDAAARTVDTGSHLAARLVLEEVLP